MTSTKSGSVRKASRERAAARKRKRRKESSSSNAIERVRRLKRRQQEKDAIMVAEGRRTIDDQAVEQEENSVNYDDHRQQLFDQEEKTDPDEFTGVHRIPDATKERIQEKCQEQLANSCMSEKCCCVCDCLHETTDVVDRSVRKCRALIKRMQGRLKPPGNLHKELQKWYDVSDLSAELAGMLLSRRGIIVRKGEVHMQMCRSCFVSLSNAQLRKAPKFAIANGLYIGELPEKYNDTTLTENAMLNLAQPIHFLAVVRGGKHSALRSHAYYFRADPGAPATMLPEEVVSKGIVGVTMVGAMTSSQKVKTRTKYQVRVKRVNEQYQWYKEFNFRYMNVGMNVIMEGEGAACKTSVVVDRTEDGGDQMDSVADRSAAVQTLEDSHWRFNAPTPPHHEVEEQNEDCEQVPAALITDFTPEDDIALTRRLVGDKDVLVRRSSAILSDFDPSFWALSFCELFPYGRGGLDESRPIRIGLEEYIKYCSRLSSRRHAKHHSFLMVGFDVIARHKAIDAVYLRAKLSPRAAISAASVRREELLRHVEHLEKRLEAISNRHRLPEPPRRSEAILNLFSCIKTGLRAYWGSNEERTQARTQLFSLQLALGQPSLFFTLSPSSSGTYRVANYAGEMADGLLDGVRTTMEEYVEFSKVKLGVIATANPMACARYFDRLMKVLIGVVLNWDEENQCSYEGEGLFGKTLGFFASTESQNSTGDLHAHMLIWLDHMPTTVNDYYAACKNARFRERIQEYAESIANSSYPIRDVCPCCSNDEIDAVPFSAEAYRKRKGSAPRTTTAICGGCGTTFGGDELITKQLQRICERDGVEEVFPMGTMLHHRLALPQPLPFDDDILSNVLKTRALLYYQTHHWYHCRGCFKPTKRTPDGMVCRMFFPKQVCKRSRWTQNDSIEICRNVGSEYLNTFVAVISNVFKSNHDLKFLAAGEGKTAPSFYNIGKLMVTNVVGGTLRIGPEKSFYMLKYTAKNQSRVENPAAIYLHAFDKAYPRLSKADSPAEAGRRCVQSMCCSLSNAQEISAPLAALFIERGSPFYASTEFENLFLRSYLDVIFEHSELDVLLSSADEGSTFKPSSGYIDYILRPMELEEVTLMDFTQKWKKRSNVEGFRFLSEHGQFTTHSMHERGKPVIATVLGDRLPDVRSTRGDIPAEDLLKFRRSVLVMFKPFRTGTDVATTNESFDAMFEQWWSNDAPVSARTYVENSNDYYASRQLARERPDDDMERYRECDAGQHDDLLSNPPSDCEDGDFSELLPEDDEAYDFAEIRAATKNVALLNRATDAWALAASSNDGIMGNVEAPMMSASDIDTAIQDAEHRFNTTAQGSSVAADLSTVTFTPTRVHLLSRDEALNGWQDPLAPGVSRRKAWGRTNHC